MTETPSESPTPPSEIIRVSVENEMKRSYLDYAMSVIVSRALPDVRDGLKPVHRRILYAMNELGFDYNKPYRKSARVTGDVMGKYHPHGNAAIYDAMVRMAQDFSMRVPLVDGQGNFGSMDGDPPAAERYTEARLDRVARSLLDDLEKETVDFKPNYDESESEPSVLPAKFPNLLANGTAGIAVGMATNIPPHNLGELIDACLKLIEDPDIQDEALLNIIQGPDFPTGGLILGRTGVYNAFKTGRGSVVMRGRTTTETIRRDREAIIITEVPYQVNKAKMLERMADCVKNKVIDGISDLRDESDRHGVRVVVELKRDAIAEVVLNQLFRHTQLQTSFGVNMLALDHGQPRLMGIREILTKFIDFREEVIVRRIKFELAKSQRRAHILIGLAIAVENIDEVIHLIKNAKDPQSARLEMLSRSWQAGSVAQLIEMVNEPGQKIDGGVYRLSEAQVRAILDLKLHRLTGLERHKIADELRAIVEQIKDFLDILSSRKRIYAIMAQEFQEIKEAHATPRRTAIEESGADFDMEDLIQKEDMVITVSQNGYIKRVPLTTYRAQKRGGKGRSGMSTREEDVVSDIFIANTHTPILFFTSHGIAHALKVYKLPLGSPQSLGKAMVNLLPLSPGEKISTILPLTGDADDLQNYSIIFGTSKGTVRRNDLSEFLNIRANGKIAMKLQDDERLVAVKFCRSDQDIFLATRLGKCIRFKVDTLRIFQSRSSMGVRGIKLAPSDEVISLSILDHVDLTIEERDAYIKLSRQKRGLEGDDDEDTIQAVDTSVLSSRRFDELEQQEQFLTTVTRHGFGKRTSAYEYRVSNRGGLGFANIAVSSRNGNVVGSFFTEPGDDVVLVTNGGKLIRFAIDEVRIAGRTTMGVTLFRIDDKEKVVAVSRIPTDCDTDDVAENSIEDTEPTSKGVSVP